MPITRPTYQLKFELDLPDEQPSAGLSTEDVLIRAQVARDKLEGGEAWPTGTDIPKWFENYLRLVHTGWPWRVACYVAWLAMPKPRKPKTQLELARDVLGLSSDRQLSVWMSKNPAIPAMVQDLRVGLIFEDLGEIVAAGVAVAKRRDYKSKGDRELIYKMTGLVGDKEEAKLPGGGRDLSSLTWEEKLALAGLDTPEAIERLKEKVRAERRMRESVIDGQIVIDPPTPELTDGKNHEPSSDAI